jgi:hypothetical protein
MCSLDSMLEFSKASMHAVLRLKARTEHLVFCVTTTRYTPSLQYCDELLTLLGLFIQYVGDHGWTRHVMRGRVGVDTVPV